MAEVPVESQRPSLRLVPAEVPERSHHPPASGSEIVFGESLEFLNSLPDACIDLVYVDPPFNTGKVQRRVSLTTVRDDIKPDRRGFKGQGYRTTATGAIAFPDRFDDYIGFLRPRLFEARRVLKPTGSLFFHIDYREVHYCKLLLDEIFGRPSFINEIIWTYDYGARSRRRWSPKHDNILWYAKHPDAYTFNFDEMDRIPYMAPSLVGPEKAARGKTPTDTWWNTIVSPTGKEKTGYPTQKPLAILERIIRVHSNPGDLVLDFFAGSGTTAAACARRSRRFIVVDNNPAAIEVMRERLKKAEPKVVRQTSKTALRNSKASAATGGASARPTPPARSDVRSKVRIIAVGVSQYDHLKKLTGVRKDLAHIEELFSASSKLGLYDSAQLLFLRDPTVEELRAQLVEHSVQRSRGGDVLVFYFSGHGCVVGSDFCFCLKDSRTLDRTGTFLSLSVLRFADLVQTICAADVHPVVIIDACYSSSASAVLEKMDEQMRSGAGRSYALLASCHADRTSADTVDGGEFTKALLSVARRGLSDDVSLRRRELRLADISGPLQTELEMQGVPLSKLYLGGDLPVVPIVKNSAFQPLEERFAPYLRDIVRFAWNNGNPREIKVAHIHREIGASAYGNHNKLRLEPWNLMEMANGSKSRKLTPRGIDFAQGKLTIPEVIAKDPDSGRFKALPGTRNIKINDV
jgi:site-specific DNA-methyltransferase (adenine-specific)